MKQRIRVMRRGLDKIWIERDEQEIFAIYWSWEEKAKRIIIGISDKKRSLEIVFGKGGEIKVYFGSIWY